jgi:hypothetical protein
MFAVSRVCRMSGRPILGGSARTSRTSRTSHRPTRSAMRFHARGCGVCGKPVPSAAARGAAHRPACAAGRTDRSATNWSTSDSATARRADCPTSNCSASDGAGGRADCPASDSAATGRDGSIGHGRYARSHLASAANAFFTRARLRAASFGVTSSGLMEPSSGQPPATPLRELLSAPRAIEFGRVRCRALSTVGRLSTTACFGSAAVGGQH